MGKMPLSKFEVDRIKVLRKKGNSITEIQKVVLRGKTTIFKYVRNIKLSTKSQRILDLKKKSGSINRKLRNLVIARELAKKLLQSHNREKLIIISTLYWAEGTKKSCSFINSDGNMISVYLKILKDVFNVSIQNLRITLRIFSGMNQFECMKYWSNITGIHSSNFIVRLNDGGTKCKVPYGMIRIELKKGDSILKILQSTYALVSEEIRLNAPVVQRIRTYPS